MLKKMLIIFLVLGMSISLFAGGDKEDAAKDSADSGEKVVIEVVSQQPEYMEQERQVWDLYTEENPNVEIKLISVNEDQMTAFMARVAANEGPAIMDRSIPKPDKTNYKIYANLLDIDYPYWDQLIGDPKSVFEANTGIKGYVPTLRILDTFPFTFIYYIDEMQKAGIDTSNVRTWDDVDSLLAELKTYVDKTDGIEYVLDTGWHSWVWGMAFPNVVSLSLGADNQEMADLYTGKIAWTDLDNNPIVPFFVKMKEYYDKGYLPNNWWTREWENDFESGFINRKSIFTLHGPWIWDKTLAADPSAKLGGFPLPANNGKLAEYPKDTSGVAILSQWVGTPEFPEIVKAFNWYNSPEVAEMVAQYVGAPPTFKTVSDDFVLDSPQYKNVIKPAINGAYGPGLEWDSSAWGVIVAGSNRVDGTPDVLMDDELAGTFRDYFNGDLSLAGLMDIFQQRWEAAYDF